MAFEIGHRLRWVRNHFDIAKGELVTTWSKLEQSQDCLKDALTKVKAQGMMIADLNDKYNRLFFEKVILKDHILSLKKKVKVIKAAAYLKTRQYLFKEFEQHGEIEWDMEAAYDAWDSFVNCDDRAEDGEEEVEEQECKDN